MSKALTKDAATDDGIHPSGTSGGHVFVRELWGFAVVCLLGAFVALAVLPPKARRYWSLLQHEADLTVRNIELRRRAEELDEAVRSLETDPLFRDATIRRRLDLKRTTEEFLREEDRTAP